MGRPTDPTIRPRLLDKILEVMRDQPLTWVTFRGLAGRLGVSSYTLTYHFGSRAELIDTILATTVKARAEIIGSIDLTTLTRDEMRSFLREGYSLSLTEPYLAGVRLQFEAGALEGVDPDMGTRIHNSHHIWTTQFHAWLSNQGAQEPVATHAARAIADMFFGAHFGFVLNHSPSSDDTERSIESVIFAMNALFDAALPAEEETHDLGDHASRPPRNEHRPAA